MDLPRRRIELSVERPGREGAGEIVRLSVVFEPGPGDPTTRPGQLSKALEELREELDGLVGGATAPPRPDRSLDELIGAYHPRQVDLIDLLRDEGELTGGEYDALRAHLANVPAAAPSAPALVAALPTPPPSDVAGEASTARSVPDLLRQYQIESLRQAGAVRARRQISFDEYMALKRHFESPPSTVP